MVWKLIGALGILLVAIGILRKDRKQQDLFYMAGGICLEIYSIVIQDVIFIILQLIFIAAAVYDYGKKHR